MKKTIFAIVLFVLTATAIMAQDLYPELKIGHQVWMKKNLDVDRYRNGEAIYQAKTGLEFSKAGDEKVGAFMIVYDTNKIELGKVYNYYALIDERGLAPKGWRVPSMGDWIEMVYNTTGVIMNDKDLQEFEWISKDDFDATLKYFLNTTGIVTSEGMHLGSKSAQSMFWSITDTYLPSFMILSKRPNAKVIWFENDNKKAIIDNFSKTIGLPVRCVK